MLTNWKARVGMIHPRVCCDMEIYDFYRAAPEDVVLVTTHLEIVDSSRRNEIESSLALVERATQRLAEAGTDLILMNGLPILLFNGNEGHQQIVERMRRAAAVPVTTAAEATCGFNARRQSALMASPGASMAKVWNNGSWQLHERIHRNAYRALPSRRQYIPKADGRLRPLGIATVSVNCTSSKPAFGLGRD